MALTAHIEVLMQKHGELEQRLTSLSTSPSANDTELSLLKRQKLQLKDQITRLKSQAA